MIAVDVDTVDRVMIDGTWHDVIQESFEVDAYSFTYEGDRLNLALGPGFQFRTISRRGPMASNGVEVTLTGPLSAVQAVETRRKSKHPVPATWTETHAPGTPDTSPGWNP